MNRDLRKFLVVILCIFLAYSIAFYSYVFQSLEEDAAEMRVIEETTLPEPDQDDVVEAESLPIDETVVISDGDTLGSLMNRLGIPVSQAQEAIQELTKIFNPRNLKAGQEIYLIYEKQKGSPAYDLQYLQLRPDFEHNIELSRTDEGTFKAVKKKKHLAHHHNHIKGEVNVSLYADALRSGASPKMVYDMIRALSFDVDFQRDIHAGDAFTMVYDTFRDEETGLERAGELSYAELTTQGKTHKVYRFQPSGGVPGYYTEAGEAVRKALLRTPVDGARISGTFGMRKKHPVLGYTKMHKGIDFAAPTGTPIMAAGDGVVEKAGRFSSYGNYILLRHNGSTKTAYAHLSKYAVKKGDKVRQGQVIGYIGATGRATGPHLHFELLQNGAHVNPRKITQMPGTKLTGKSLNAFKSARDKVNKLIQTIPPGGSVADNKA